MMTPLKEIINFIKTIDLNFKNIYSNLIFFYMELIKRPFFLPSFFIISGIIFENIYNISFGKLLFIQILSVTLTSILIIFKKKRYIIYSIYILIFICGVTLSTIYNYQNYKKNLSSYMGKQLLIHGKVEKIYRYQNRIGGILKSDYLVINNFKKNCIGRVKFNSKFTGEITINSNFFLDGRLLPIHSFHNFDKFPYEELMIKNGISGIIKNGKLIISDNKKSIFNNLRKSIINSLKIHFSRYLSPVQTSLVLSILLGMREYNREIFSIFKDSGLIHLLVVSGFHITIISTILLFFLYGEFGIITAILSLIFYLYLTNFTPSVSRAVFMSIVLLSGKLIGKKSDNLNNLFFSLFVLIILKPTLIYNMGFCFTYSITFSIIYIYPKLSMIKNKWLKLSIVVLSGMTPISMFFLGYTNFTTIFSSPVGMIICEFILIYSIISIPFLYIPIPVIFLILKPLEFSIDLLFYSAKLFSTYSFYFSNFQIYRMIYIIIIMIIFISLIDYNKYLKLRKKYIVTSFFIIFLLIFIKKDKPLSVDFMDIGQGDAILFENGDKSFFVDVGDDSNLSFDKAIKPYILRNSIDINSIIITHIDKDHSGNSGYLNNFFKNIKFYFPITLKNSLEFKKFIRDKKINRNQIFFLKKGDTLNFNSITLKILWPEIENLKPKNDDNYNSLVILAQTTNLKLLLMADSPRAVEKNIISQIDEKIDILKVSHHGSKSGTSLNFLRKIKPEYSIISAGFMNKYKHPHKEVIYNLSKSGTKILDTISYGMIKFIGKKIINSRKNREYTSYQAK